MKSAMLLPTMPTSTSDDKQLQLAKTLWVEGDWEALAALSDEIDNKARNIQFKAYIAAAFAQLGEREKAAVYLLQHWGSEVAETSDKLWCYRLLISGVHNSLARARVVNGEIIKSQDHWFKSVDQVISGPQQRLAEQIRAKHQLKQLELPESWAEKSFDNDGAQKSVAHVFLKELHKQYPNEPAILIGLAESAQRQGWFDEAIRHWQALASILQEKTPQAYYDRLDEAYQNQKSFPLGSPDEELLRGDGDKHEVLKQLHQILKPSLYLEIGVQTGKSLRLSNCEAIGIDPMPRPNIKLRKNHTLLRMTSDEFFDNHATQYLASPPDLVFIDGMHLFEYALRDFINVERYAGPNTVVVIDDIFPGHAAQAERVRRTRAWTGDVWKLAAVLEQHRPDLTIKKLDVYPTGLMIIKGFSILRKESDTICFKEYSNMLPYNALDDYIARKNSCSFSPVYHLL